jgi:hypothetical protein
VKLKAYQKVGWTALPKVKDSARQKENCWVTWLVNGKASKMGREKEKRRGQLIL